MTSVTDDPKIYHLTFSVLCTPDEARLLVYQLGRIIEVNEVFDATNKDIIIREFMLIKIDCPEEKIPEILGIEIYNSPGLKIAGRGENCVTVEVTGNPVQLDAVIIELGKKYGVINIVRSGTVCVMN